MQKIVPHLWFKEKASEAAQLYEKIFPDCKIISNVSHENPDAEGGVDIVKMDLAGLRIWLLSADGAPGFNPSLSFIVRCDSIKEVEALWMKLAQGAEVLMELGEYPFSKRFGWLADKYGVSWQIMAVDELGDSAKVTPTLLFVGDVCGKAEEAMNKYTGLFDNSSIGNVQHYPAGASGEAEGEAEGDVLLADFNLAGMDIACMDSALGHKFEFNQATAFAVFCETQAEIDKYWEQLSADPEKELGGWLVDKFGISWIIVPAFMDRMMEETDTAILNRVDEVLMKMKKLNLAELEKAYEGK
jgi:predicted 3-demethylubiquinone-9 3-methyltransferase (glyoxalase superfamily)